MFFLGVPLRVLWVFDKLCLRCEEEEFGISRALHWRLVGDFMDGKWRGETMSGKEIFLGASFLSLETSDKRLSSVRLGGKFEPASFFSPVGLESSGNSKGANSG